MKNTIGNRDMKIKIQSRYAVLKLINEGEVPKGTAVISITDPEDDLPVFKNNNLEYVFRMSFWDIEEDYSDKVKKVTSENFDGLKAFVDKLVWNKCPLLIVHCTVGVSRSASVAAAIADYATIPHNIMGNSTFEPNMHVYYLCCKELGI